jgi:hypothetical protein
LVGAVPPETVTTAHGARVNDSPDSRHSANVFIGPAPAVKKKVEDVKQMAPDVLRHRVLTSYEAEARDVTADQVVKQVLDSLPVP